ncbi:DNA translocase FtsK 4TM domain-containing protein [Paraglaciecola aquimarina]|uniref:DNA translocase FtsK n=1 Tax=Paraglaciecola algarum TaxID=3050085 RepID=A0ABS9D2S5_9ALTE|nr:DNA translocase FtsK 4TM domain-containing protein [Paraglaciecola sp. G1-23]MCF2947035.1 DNA translocase FtsK 4TM domain-containing protein [Paraglaciecola sp. G1-23]
MARLTGIQRIMEVGMMLSSLFALFLLLALTSFHQADPGWSQAGLQTDVNNWVGPIGAWLADILFFTFGSFAYALPFACAFVGWFLFQQTKNLLEIDYLNIGLRIIGVILLVLGTTGLLSMNANDIFDYGSGGVIGDILSSSLVPYFSLVGTTLALLSFFCAGVTLLSGISWLTIIDKLGELVIFLGTFVYHTPAKLKSVSIPLLEKKENDSSPVPNSGSVKFSSEATSSDLGSSQTASAEPYWSATHGNDSHLVDDATFNIEPSIPQEIFDESEPKTTKKSPISVSELKKKITKSRSKEKSEAKFEPAAGSGGIVTARPVDVPSSEEDETQGPMPSFELLERPDKIKNPITPEELEIVSRLLEAKLADFNIEARVVGVYPGPVITRFEMDLAPGVKVSKITTLSKDLARSMSAISVRVVEVIPGKSVIGLELPNKKRDMVRLSEVIVDDVFQSSESPLTMVLGADISGNPVFVDLAKMPHLLVAGTTGSGKSVGVNVMILSLLYKSTPEDVRMIMIDPKMLELSVYEGIPHLLAEVVTDMKEAANALRWCVGEMERRYKLMSALGVRNLKGFNTKVLKAIEDGEPIRDPLWKSEESMETEAPFLEKLPAIVVVVDEFADMMMIVGKKVEELIARIAQKARAAGIHLVLATQRPSVDVITGLIKANIPTRIAFQVSSKIDSRTILDQQGAEALLGAGDMLYLPPGTGVPTRVHGAFVDDHEVHAVVADWKKRGAPQYIDEILNGDASAEILLPGEQPEGEDQEFDVFYDEAVAFVTETRRASVSSVQRKFRIGYNRAARLVEQMEQSGVVSSQGHNGNREVLASPAPRD